MIYVALSISYVLSYVVYVMNVISPVLLASAGFLIVLRINIISTPAAVAKLDAL
jgi:hypothetical protein